MTLDFRIVICWAAIYSMQTSEGQTLLTLTSKTWSCKQVKQTNSSNHKASLVINLFCAQLYLISLSPLDYQSSSNLFVKFLLFSLFAIGFSLCNEYGHLCCFFLLNNISKDEVASTPHKPSLIWQSVFSAIKIK